ncbi:MAG: DOMON-like domain-containing protein [Sphingomonadales bacterium]
MSSYRGELVRHAGSPESPVERIIVSIEQTLAEATITYEVIGDLVEVVLPDVGQSERRDGLWTTTCLELFAKPVGGETYLEWNFAPNTAWAAYRFDGYRAGMRNADVPPPFITAISSDAYRMTVITALPPLPCWVGLSAVIRDIDGGTSYWALAHPPGKADFHHADCFVAELAPSKGA